jgi:uncharacterized protein YndB with AHSA1/START domain
MARQDTDTKTASPPPSATGIDLVINRVFDAPRDLVFMAWTRFDHAMHWAPKGFTITEFRMDLRPGGAWRLVMRSAEGKDYPQGGVIREVIPPERLVYTFAWDESPEEETLIELTLVERGGKTEMTFRQSGFRTVESRNGHAEGWGEAFDSLAEAVARAAGRMNG